MSGTPEKQHLRKRTAAIVSSTTNNEKLFNKTPKLANKPHYEGSEATDTDNYHYEKATENTEYKEEP